MFERFTTPARDVVVRAQQEARELRHPTIGTEHLLLAMLRPEAGLAGSVLQSAGVHADEVRADIRRWVDPGPSAPLGDDDAAALQTIGIDLRAVLDRIGTSFGPHAVQPPAPTGRRGLLRRLTNHVPFTPRAKKVLELSLREALRLRHSIGPAHILLGLLREGQGLGRGPWSTAGTP